MDMPAFLPIVHGMSAMFEEVFRAYFLESVFRVIFLHIFDPTFPFMRRGARSAGDCLLYWRGSNPGYSIVGDDYDVQRGGFVVNFLRFFGRFLGW